MRTGNRAIRCLVLVIGLVNMAESQINQSHKGEARPRGEVVFVCEHGAALSVVSAAYFNKIAQERRLNLHAIARGVEPQANLSVSARQGLDLDGVSYEKKRPKRLTINEAGNARRVVAFCPLPSRFRTPIPVETWTDVPPTGAGYTRARDAILIHLRELIQQLESAEKERR